MADPPVTALAFSPDGAFLLNSGHKKILIRAVKDRSRRMELDCDLAKITSLAFSPDGRILAVGGGTPGESGQVKWFAWGPTSLASRSKDASANANHSTLPAEFDDVVTALSFSSDGAKVAIASADHSVDVVSIADGLAQAKRIYSLTEHSGPVLGAAFSPKGNILVTVSADRSVKVWDAATGRQLRSFSHHTAIVHCVTFKPLASETSRDAPALCASGSDDKTVRVWQPEIGRMVRIVRYHDGPVLALAYSRDGTTLFSAGSEGTIRVIDAESDNVLHHWQAHNDWIYALALNPEGQILATGDWTGLVKLWAIRNGTWNRIEF